MIAAIRIRGDVNLTGGVRTTLDSLRLRKKHTCILLEPKPELVGMLKRVKDFITWGDISDELVQQLTSSKNKGDVFFLHPPRGGFERKGIKIAYTQGGVLGYRKDGIDDLIKRMQK